MSSYSFSSFTKNLKNLSQFDYKQDLALNKGLSPQEIASFGDALDFFVQCEDLSHLTPHHAEHISSILTYLAFIHRTTKTRT